MSSNPLPVNWEMAPLEKVATVQLGKMLDKAKNTGSLRPYLRNINVRWFDFDLSDLAQIRMSDTEAEHFNILDGDLLVCEGGEPGRCAIWSGGQTNLTYQKALHRVRVSEAFNSTLLSWQLRLDSMTGELGKHFSGSTIKHLPQVALQRYPVRVPPRQEQQRIADKLDIVLARVDACRDRLARVAPLLKRFRQSVLAAATSGRLTEEWRALGKVGPWRSTTIEMICISVADGDHQAPPQATSGVPFITISAINDGRLSLQKATRYVPQSYFQSLAGKRRPQCGDVLYSVTASLGIPAIVDTDKAFAFQRHIAILRPKPEVVSTEFLYYVLSSEEVRRQAYAAATGTAQLTLALSSLRAIAIDIPAPLEQAEVVRRVGILFAFADRLEARLARAQTAVERLTPSLLAKAFRGELVPQDPNDEPAAELLKRLAAQRDAAPVRTRRSRVTPSEGAATP